MLNILKFIVDKLLADDELKTFVNNRIFPSGVDITPEAPQLFPLITFNTVLDVTRTVPRGARDSIYQIDVWSILSQEQVEQISERIIAILNFNTDDNGYLPAKLRWIREDGSADLYEADRRIWHKSLRFKTWASL